MDDFSHGWCRCISCLRFVEVTTELHPLEGSDLSECYKVMMSERTALITARRETEDNLIKTVIQLSSAMIVLMAGFVSQAETTFTGITTVLFVMIIVVLVLVITSGLTEQFYSSRAYLEQQALVESYYNREISSFDEPKANKFVRASQAVAFILFIIALILLGSFAILQVGGETDAKQTESASTASTASTSTASTASTASSTASKSKVQRWE